MADINAMFQGKGGGSPGKGGGKGAWGAWNPTRGKPAFQGGKAGGKGQGGKGGFDTKNAANIARRRARETGAQALCPSEAKYGVCTYEQWSGKPCQYMHVKNLPGKMSAIDGLISTDLKGLPITTDFANNVHVCGPCTDQALIDKLVQEITAETGRMANIIAEENDYEFNIEGTSADFNSSPSAPGVQSTPTVFPGRV